MGFVSIKQLQYKDPIRANLIGEGNTGKSTLAAAFMRHFSPGVYIPTDERLNVPRLVADELGFDFHVIAEDTAVWQDVERILAILEANVRSSGINSIVWDSLSPIFRSMITQAQSLAALSADERKARLAAMGKVATGNKSALYQDKSLFMEQVAELGRFGTNVLWISHEWEGTDQYGKETVKTTVTEQELKKFVRNTNMKLRTFRDAKGYGVELSWVRDKPSLNGEKIYDEAGHHANTWQVIEDLLYDAPVVTFWDREVFSSPEEAVTLAAELTVSVGGQEVPIFGKGDVGGSVKHAQNAYDKVKAEGMEKGTIKSAEDMAAVWIADVKRRAEKARKEVSHAAPDQSE